MELRNFLKFDDFMWNDCDASQLTANNFALILWCKPIHQLCVEDILGEKNKCENEPHKAEEQLKSVKNKDPENGLVIWIGQINAENEKPTEEIIKEQANVLGQQTM
jgi:hypothetical protein